MPVVKERPAIMAGESVRAILEGRKTHTRRVITPVPTKAGLWTCANFRAGLNLNVEDDRLWAEGECRHGQKGERLWVREAWRAPKSLDLESPGTIARAALDAGYKEPWCPVRYGADGSVRHGAPFRNTFGDQWGRARASMHMPRWASRLLLEILDVQAERLQVITTADILAEGLKIPDVDYNVPERPDVLDHERDCYARDLFSKIWDRLNGKRGFGWESNPWVWRIEFKLWEVR